MPQQVTTPKTRELITRVNVELGNVAYDIIQTPDEIFSKANSVQEEICRNTFCLNEPAIETDLIPDKWKYSYISLVDSVQNILKIDVVRIINPDGSQSLPLTKIPQTEFYKRQGDTSVSIPKYYDFDGKVFLIWKPYSLTGYRIKIECARLPLQAEQISYDNDPVCPYFDSLVWGTIAQCIASRKDLIAKFNLEYYDAQYQKYKAFRSKSVSSDNDSVPFNELNL